MRYTGRLFRPPSEAHSYILQATIGCSHNLCTYCDMYRDKQFSVRPLAESREDIAMAAARHGRHIEKVFVADGDALAMPMSHWSPLLADLKRHFPRLRQVSCYATAGNLLEKTTDELAELVEQGLNLLYIGPESGDDPTLKRIVKGATAAEHIEAAERAHDAGMRLSAIFLLGAGGVERSQAHAEASADLVTKMNPAYLAALTLTLVPNTPMWRMQEKGKFVLPEQPDLLRELRTLVDRARPTAALFRTNHASNYLPLSGSLPRDRERIVATIDAALSGEIPLRPEWSRGL